MADPQKTAEDLRAAEMVQWFVEAGFDPPPSTQSLANFVEFIEIASMVIPEKKEIGRKRNPDRRVFERALADLGRIVPSLLAQANQEEEEARERFANRKVGSLSLYGIQQKASSYRALLEAVESAFGRPSLRRGKRSADWHELAKSTAGHIRLALRQSGHNDPKFTSARGPGTKVLQRSLACIEGFERKSTQIVEPFRSGR